MKSVIADFVLTFFFVGYYNKAQEPFCQRIVISKYPGLLLNVMHAWMHGWMDRWGDGCHACTLQVLTLSISG